jgi:type II secretory pathway pseudopilin PulG
MSLNRRGLSLVELLVSMVVLAFVGLAMASLIRSMMNATTAQVQVAAAQGNGRTGILAIPQELREVGYDTIPTTTATDSDLESIAADRLTFRAMRGMGITCGTPTTQEFRIRKPIVGIRDPLLTDGFLLFLDNDPNLAGDDQWVPMVVSNIDLNSTCGADPAIMITLSAAPIWNPPSGAMVVTQQFVGGPVRWYERLEYGPVTDATTGQAFIGVRSLSLSQTTLTPVIGPLTDLTGFAFTYYNAAGTVLDPATSPPIDVRSIGLSIKTVPNQVVSLAGSTRRALRRDSVQTRIALRNAIRP